ncbi:hypothetical protein SCUCBS95973_007482 [Sporothrix curviconia]|uniref:Aminoglycoside phosphotransferase domain-containing protein n=1 Tax=Sporothrix curviconia TaxID=1260050 RepID=A0ABP0CDN0_9PEZI
MDISSSTQAETAMARILALACPETPAPAATQAVLGFPTEAGLSSGQFAAGLNAALRQGEVLWQLYDIVVVALGPAVVVKVDSATSLDSDGISNLAYINEHMPQLPAPKVLGALTCGQRSYFFMTRGRGVTLEAAWPDISTEGKRDVQAQLTQVFADLRQSPRPRSGQGQGPQQHAITAPLGSFVMGLCKDTRHIQRVSNAHDPLCDEEALNDFLVKAPPRRSTPTSIRMLRPVMRDDHDIVMTHADLHPRNITVEWVDNASDASNASTGPARRCKITSILDWEMAGWYPAYWEFVKAMCNASPRGPLSDWPEYLPTDAIGLWPVEYALDSLIGRWLG